MKHKIKKIVTQVTHNSLAYIKKSWIWMLVGLVVVLWFGAVFFFVGSGLEKIFSYVPQNVGQVFVIRVSNTNNVLYQWATEQIAGDFQETLKKIEIAVIAQKTVDQIQENLIFVQAKLDFDPQELLDAMNSEAEIEYIYQKLDKKLYVFGKPEALKYIKEDSVNNFFAYEKLLPFKTLLRNSDISFFSRVESDTIDVTQVSPFLANLDYFVYGLETENEKLSMEANMIYKNDRAVVSDYTFKPLLNSYLNDKSLLFLELGNIIQQMGIKKEDFMASLTYFLTSQWLTNFTPQEYEAFYESLNNNIVFGVGEGNNLLGIGMYLIFKNSDLFGVLSKVVPSIYQQLSSIPLMSGFDITLVQEANRQGFSSLVGGIQEVWLYAEKKEDSTLITIWDPEVKTPSEKVKVEYSKNSLGYFYANFDNIIDLYKKFGGAVWLEENDQFAFFEKKTLQGHIVSQADRIVVKAVIE